LPQTVDAHLTKRLKDKALDNIPKYKNCRTSAEKLAFINKLISHISAYKLDLSSEVFQMVVRTAFQDSECDWYEISAHLIFDLDTLRQQFYKRFLSDSNASFESRRMLFCHWVASRPSAGQSLADFAIQQKRIYESSKLSEPGEKADSLPRLIMLQMPLEVREPCELIDNLGWEKLLNFLQTVDMKNASRSERKPFICSNCGPNLTHYTRNCTKADPKPVNSQTRKPEVFTIANGTEDSDSSDLSANVVQGNPRLCPVPNCGKPWHPLDRCWTANPCTFCGGRHPRRFYCRYDPANSETYNSEVAIEHRKKYPIMPKDMKNQKNA
jgi:hypothetical protein